MREVIRSIARLLSGRLRLEVPQPASAGAQDAPRGAMGLPAGEIEARYRSGLVLLGAGNFSGAEAALRAVVEARHDHADAHYALGKLYERSGRPQDATDSYLLATSFKPDFATAYYRLGALAAEAGRGEEALGFLSQATGCDPAYAEAYNYMGKLYLDTRRPEEAQACFRKAVAASPDFAPAWSNLGYVVHDRESNLEEALACAERAIALDYRLLQAHGIRAKALQSLGRSEESLRACDEALALDPAHAPARVNRAIALLTQGDFERGWAEYEARKASFQCFRFRPFPYPEWDGAPLAGRTLLVYAEQGLGDEIMFASCLPRVLEEAGRVVIDCHPKLERLYRRSFVGAAIHGGYQDDPNLSWLERVPRIDVRIPVGSLPALWRRRVEDFPRHEGYLRADPQRVAHWRGRLAALGPGLKVGLSWRGGSKVTHRSLRSVELGELAPLLRVPGARFVSVQYSDCRQELETVRREHGLHVPHWQEAIDDYDETAALLCALDLVISVQTAIVHLAGALARPTWVMVPANPEWRYQRSGGDMPWYPAVRIVRQRELRDWQPVIERVARDLGEFVAAGGAQGRLVPGIS